MGVTSRWINPNAVPLTQDRFSDNGTFSAAKEGKYGYEKVTVGVETDRIYGKDPDTDEDMEVREEPEPKDPYRPDEGGGGGGEGGEKPPHLVETVLPSQIAVVKPPKRTTYMPGEDIDYKGIETQARLKSGQAWDGFPRGMIPFKELEFPVKKVEGTYEMYIPPYTPSGTTFTVETLLPTAEAARYLLTKTGLADYPTKLPTVPTLLSYVESSIEDFIHTDNCIVWVDIPGWNGTNWTVGVYQGYDVIIGRTYAAGWRTAGCLMWIEEDWNPGQGGPGYPHTHYNKFYNRQTEFFAGEKYEETENGVRWFVSCLNAHGYLDGDIPIYTATSDLDCGIAQPIRFSDRGVAVCAPETEGGSRHRETRFSGGCIALAPRGNAICYITASAGGGSMDIDDRWIDEDAGSESEESETVSTDSQFTYDGKTVRFTRGSVAMDGAIASYLPDTASDGAALLQHAGEIAWTMVYGEVSGADKALPVQWARPGDGKVLETAFNISVATPVE